MALSQNLSYKHPSKQVSTIGMTFWGWPWRADQSDKKYDALIDAVVNVFGERPQAVLSGSYFTFPAILRKLSKKNMVVYSLGSFYDFQLTQDERLSVDDFMNGIKVVTRLVHYVVKDKEAEEAKGKGKGKKK